MRTIIGIFDNKAEAERAIVELEAAGASASDISVLSADEEMDLADIHLNSLDVQGHGRMGASGPLQTFLTQSTATAEPDAIVAALMKMGLPASYAEDYVEAIGRGLLFEAVFVEDSKAETALSIMRAHTSSDVAKPAAAAESASIPVTVEELKVGKREVGSGGVHVTSRVTETPITQEVTLRQERIDVERHPADRPVTDTEAAFKERTIDVVATSEEPVVAKRARVIEEVVVRKDIGTTTQTIHEKVRRTDVKVERLAPFELSTYEPHFKSYFAGDPDYGLVAFAPAYRFGHEMRGDLRFAGESWNEVEPTARKAWEEKNPGTWERFKSAIRHAWESAKG
jgi:uncharacterized protein (TIGR02271 family)